MSDQPSYWSKYSVYESTDIFSENLPTEKQIKGGLAKKQSEEGGKGVGWPQNK